MLIDNNEIYNINSLNKKIHVSKTKIERAMILLKNQEFIRPTDNTNRNFKLDGDIKCCIGSREEVETLINQELTSPDDIMNAHAEAIKPTHAAISLDGEPLLFPKMSQFIQEFKNRNMTTFIVTNGTLPQKIMSLDPLPSQLYITLAAPNEMIYKKTCRPMIRNGWSNIMDSMDLVESLSTRTLIRLTAVKNLNINENLINDYIKIIEKANPNFFEIKGFTLQAKALLIKERLQSDKPIQYYFPDYEFLDYIASKFEERGNFPLIYKNEVSRDFLFAVNWNKDTDVKLKNL